MDEGFLGVGWGAAEHADDWPSYERAAIEKDGGVNPSVRALHEMREGSLIWTRDTKGVYYLARIQGPWRYLSGEDAECFDVRNVRPARIVRCGVEARVPGKVANAFRGPRALQRISDEAALRYSISLFAELTGQPAPWRPSPDEVLKTCLTALDLEDLVAAYLQRRHGYVVFPGSRRRDTPAYEYTLRHPDDGHIAVVQVKSGREPVPCGADSLPGDSTDRIFVFSPTGAYSGEPAAAVKKLTFDDLINFMDSEPTCLPLTVQHWLRAID